MAAVTQFEPIRRKRASTVEELSFDNVYEFTAFVSSEIRASGLKYSVIARKADVCAGTVSKLAYGTTKAPQVRTSLAILRVLGWHIVARK